MGLFSIFYKTLNVNRQCFLSLWSTSSVSFSLFCSLKYIKIILLSVVLTLLNDVTIYNSNVIFNQSLQINVFTNVLKKY